MRDNKLIREGVRFDLRGLTKGLSTFRFTLASRSAIAEAANKPLADIAGMAYAGMKEFPASILTWGALRGGGLRKLTRDDVDLMLEAYIEDGGDIDELLLHLGKALKLCGAFQINPFDEEELKAWREKLEQEREEQNELRKQGAEKLPTPQPEGDPTAAQETN